MSGFPVPSGTYAAASLLRTGGGLWYAPPGMGIAGALSALKNEEAALIRIGLADWRDQATALPLVAFYGENQMYLRLNEELYVAISNATNGQQYVAVVQAQDIQESAARSVNVQ